MVILCRVVLFGLFSLILVACGSGSSGSSSGGTPEPTISPDHRPNEPFSLTVVNLPKTVFVNQTESVSFIFTNESATSISLAQSVISFPAPIEWTNQVDGCSNQTVNVGESCVISGTFNLPVANQEVIYSLKFFNNESADIYDYVKSVLAVTANDGYLAVRFDSLQNSSHKVYVTVTSGGDANFVNFTAPNYTGTLATYESVDYSTNAIQVGGAGAVTNVLYLPQSTNGKGGRIYVSLDNPLYGTTDPSVSAPTSQNLNTVWSTIEYYYDTSNPISNFDISNVNSVSLPISMSIVDSNNNQVNNIGIKYDPTIAATTVIDMINESLAVWPDSWAKLGSVNAIGTSSLIAILSATNYLAAPNQNSIGFESAKFNLYTDDLWDYYTTNAMQIDVTNIAAGCYLTAQVDANDDLMHFNPSPNATCPVTGITGPSSFTMTKFTVYDYIGAAGNVNDTTFGANGTYRSWAGETIVALQSMGFLPYCTEPNAIFSKAFVASKDPSTYYTPQYETCLTNYDEYKEEVINQYAYQSYLYFAYYGYGYGDWLGLDGDISNQATAFPVTFTPAKWD